MRHAVKSSPMDVVKEYFLEKKLLFVCGGYMPGKSLWVHSNGVSGKPTFHRRTNLSWLSKICNRFGEIDSGSRKSLTSIKAKWRLRANFHKCFPNAPQRTRKQVFLCKFREIWATGSRWNRALFNGQKTKFRLALPLPLLRGSRPKFVRAAPNNKLGVPKFHPNPFTSDGVIAERVNIVQTRHKAFAILGEASASSPSNKEVNG